MTRRKSSSAGFEVASRPLVQVNGRSLGIRLQSLAKCRSLTCLNSALPIVRLTLMDYLLIALKLIVALGILNVWLLRSGKATSYRGKNAQTLREEFAVYGLPYPVFCLIGFLKVGLALTLLASIWLAGLAQPAALGMGTLMLGAFVMHLKVKDPFSKALPSLAVLALCLAIAFL